MKKSALVLVCCCILFSGCDMREISDELYAVMLGVDKNENGVTLTVAVPGYQSTEEYKTEVLSIDAKDTSEGLEKLRIFKSRKISLQHLKAVVVSENLAREGINRYISPIKNHPETANAMGIMISDGKASKVVSNVCDNTSGEVSSELEVLLLSEKYNPYCPVVLFDKFYNSIKSEYRSPFAYFSDKNGAFKGIAVFDKDKMTGILDIEESAYIMIAKGKLDGGYLDLDTSEGSAKVRIYTRKHKITVEDSVKIEVELVGKMDYSPHLSKVKREIIQRIQSGIKASVLKAYSSGSDILGLSGYSAKNYKTIGEWKKSNPDFDNISVSVKLELSQSVNG